MHCDLQLRYSDLMAPKIATANVVGFSELLDFIRPRHKMVLTTFRADASLQSSPVTGGIDGQGRVVIASYPRRAKSVRYFQYLWIVDFRRPPIQRFPARHLMCWV